MSRVRVPLQVLAPVLEDRLDLLGELGQVEVPSGADALELPFQVFEEQFICRMILLRLIKADCNRLSAGQKVVLVAQVLRDVGQVLR